MSERNPPRSPFQGGHFSKGGGSTRFRDEALAVVTSAPPDQGYYEAGRRAWRAWVARLAARLDERRAGGGEKTRADEVLAEVFRVFLPLVDPGWWRAHPPLRLNATKRRHLRRVRKLGKRAARYRWPGAGRDELYPRLCAAIEAFVRAGDEAAVERCRRLVEEMSYSAPLPAAAEAAGGFSGHERRSAGRGPTTHQRRRGRDPQPPPRRVRDRRARERR